MDRWRPFSVAVERWEPFRNFGNLQGEVDQLFDSFFGRPTVAAGERMWAPLADMRETKEDVVLTFELPGISEKDVSLSIMGDVLTMKGERKLDRDQEGDGYYQRERVYGKFERSVPLPVRVQSDKVKATYRDGVLEVRLPKAEEVKPKAIKIEVA